MVRILVAVALLLAFVTGMKFALQSAFATLGFWPGMAICLVVGCSAIAAAFAYDRASSRSQ
jgi:hypothetical protein